MVIAWVDSGGARWRARRRARHGPEWVEGSEAAIHLSTLEGSPTIITTVCGRPFQGRFPSGLLSPGHSASQR
ncbi:hypothetical protein [Segatella baroniae]|uniref:hypothetical protein n=1 Tax=Segatella baroniae TaxID=305719 RepID=UPI0012DF32A0|nr:hypothetical protein [Segatella baroniae]